MGRRRPLDILLVAISAALIAGGSARGADDGAALAGHWEGRFERAGVPLPVAFDLAVAPGQPFDW